MKKLTRKIAALVGTALAVGVTLLASSATAAAQDPGDVPDSYVTFVNVGDVTLSFLAPGGSYGMWISGNGNINFFFDAVDSDELATGNALLVRGFCTGDNGQLSDTFDPGEPSFGGTVIRGVVPPGSTPVCEVGAYEYAIYPTVTCLGGNGRVDVNVLNLSADAHDFALVVGNLAPRVRTVRGLDWWRNPITGRPDGALPAQILRDGEVVWEQDLVVACDDQPAVASPEIQIITPCRNGRGFVAWQFANPTAETRSYVIELERRELVIAGSETVIPNRSTTAGPYGASVRGASNLENGQYRYTIRVSGVVHTTGDLELTCEPS